MAGRCGGGGRRSQSCFLILLVHQRCILLGRGFAWFCYEQRECGVAWRGIAWRLRERERELYWLKGLREDTPPVLFPLSFANHRFLVLWHEMV